MSITWETHRRRSEALRRVITEIDSGKTHQLPWDDHLASVFRDQGDLLVCLHDAWKRRLLGRVDLALEIEAQPAETTVATVWLEVADELPGVRRVLDHHAAHPALATSLRYEHQMLAVAAGLAALGDPAEISAKAGERFVERLRSTTATASLGGRLTNLVAALVRW